MLKQLNAMKWTRIEIDDPVLSSEGLLGLEECTDYELTNVTKEKSKRKASSDIHKAKKRKRIITSMSPDNVTLTPSKCGSSFEVTTNSHESTLKGFETWTNFGLPDPLIKALCEQGFVEPTPIQSLTLPSAILGRKDVVGAAETGSGKTLAFGLPILTGILKQKLNKETESTKKPLYALILTPTRELAIQVKNHLTSVAKHTDINIAVVVGGMAAVKQERILKKGPEIVVATPGRLWELIQDKNEHLSQFEHIRYLAIDETDRMLEKGHFEELHDLLERLNFDESVSQKRQNFVFSATLTLVHDLPKYLLKKSKISKMTSEQKLQKIISILGIKNPKIVDITSKNLTPDSLTECKISCGFNEKDYYIYYFLQKHPGRTLIFCNSIGCVKRLSNLLNILDCHPLPLHASMQQRQRLKNLERFKEQQNGILIATDVAARGLDIPKVEHVLHYQTPRTSESYIHRSGRTARASQHGLTLVLVEPSELKSYIKLRKTLNKSEELPVFPIEVEFLEAVKQRVNLARELDKLELEIKKTNSEEGWLQKAAKEMDIIVEDFDKKYEGDTSSQKKIANLKRKQLTALLNKPVFPKGFSGKYLLGLGNFPSVRSAVEIVKDSVENKKEKKKHKLKL